MIEYVVYSGCPLWPAPPASGSAQPPCCRRDVVRRPGRRRGAVAEPDEQQEDHREQQGGQLEPVLEGLHERDRPHAAGEHADEHHEGDDQAAEPGVEAGGQPQRQARALELGDQVEPADADDQHRRDRPDVPRPEPGLGEVGQRVGARAAQRGGDQDQQHEVAGGPADGVPEHLRAEGEHQAGDAEEGGGGEVLAADRRRVERRAARCGRRRRSPTWSARTGAPRCRSRWSAPRR